jgi:hypothetical protein
MAIHTTNYFNTFIIVADDCVALLGEAPPVKADNKTIAAMQFDMVHQHPYQYTSDDVLFQVFADKNDITRSQYKTARAQFYSKGQPCFRASPLTKRYGWGIHYNAEGKMAIYGRESPEYKKFATDKSIKVIKAMKSAK